MTWSQRWRPRDAASRRCRFHDHMRVYASRECTVPRSYMCHTGRLGPLVVRDRARRPLADALARGYDSKKSALTRYAVQARTAAPRSRRTRRAERRLGSAESRPHILRQVERAAARRRPTKVLRRRMFAKRRLQLDRAISASRRVEAPSRHRSASSPGMMEVGGLFFDVEAILTPRRSPPWKSGASSPRR